MGEHEGGDAIVQPVGAGGGPSVPERRVGGTPSVRPGYLHVDAREEERVPVRVPQRRFRHAPARPTRRGAAPHRARPVLRVPARHQLGVPLRRRALVGHRRARRHCEGQHQLLDHPGRLEPGQGRGRDGHRPRPTPRGLARVLPRVQRSQHERPDVLGRPQRAIRGGKHNRPAQAKQVRDLRQRALPLDGQGELSTRIRAQADQPDVPVRTPGG